MAEIGIKIKPITSTIVKTSIEARIANIIITSIKTQPLAAITDEISILNDEGVIEINKELIRCSQCGQIIEPEDITCKNCGKNVRDELKEDFMEDMYSEFEKDEDTAVYEQDRDNLYNDTKRPYDLTEKFTNKLIEAGWFKDDVEKAGVICAYIWEQYKPEDMKSFEAHLEECKNQIESNIIERIKEADIKEIIFEEFKELKKEEEEKNINVDKEFCDISILKEDNKWIVDVFDPLANYNVVAPEKKINIGNIENNFFIKIDRWINIVDERKKNLKKLGEILLEKRESFFEAKTKEEAEKELSNQPLHQKEVAREMGISESTLSRWCNNVKILTIHGTFLLKNFFKIATGKGKAGPTTKEGLKSLIKEIENKNINEILEVLKDKHGIEMTERNLRYYLQENLDLL